MKKSAKAAAKNARTPDPRVKSKRRGGAAKAIETPHPLSFMEEYKGFKLTQRWPKLFELYTRGSEARAELCAELRDIERALFRNRSVEDVRSTRLEAAFFNTLVIQEFLRFGKKWPDGLDEIAGSIGFTAAETIGPDLVRLYSATTEAKAEMAATDILADIKRTLSHVVRMKFPTRARGSGEESPKKLLAIAHARAICEDTRRLPTKREVRAKLEAIGVSYRNTKDEAGKWRTMFDSAGLADLPD